MAHIELVFSKVVLPRILWHIKSLISISV